MATAEHALNLNQLRTFEAVARLASFTAAARELAISQPAVTVQVRELESHFGLPLVDRSRAARAAGRAVLLTREGESLYRYATQIVTAARQAEQAIRGARGLESGRLPLVATATAASYFLPPVIREFKRRHPGVAVQLLVLNSQEALARLRALQADLGVMTGEIRDARLVTVPFFEDRLVLAVAPGHRLARRRSVPARDLAGEPLITRERGSATRALIEAEFRRAGVTLEAAMELASNEATLQIVAAGHHAAVVSAEMARREVEAGRIVALPVRGVNLSRTFWFAFPKERAHYPTIQEFIDAARRAPRRL
jgi:LysR family transcriptional regulator, low CO2-responsive transcriptional regulator